MRFSYAAVLLAAMSMAACGGGRQDGIVQMRGLAPDTSLQLAKDIRTVATFCPGCAKPTEVDTERCMIDKKVCSTQMRWYDTYTCSSCRGSGACSACRLMEQADGSCYNCRGEGVRIYIGQSKECPNCKGTKKCPVCKGSRKCDYCEGAGKISKEIVKERARKSLPKEEGAEAAPAPAPAPAPAAAPAEEKK